MCNMFSQFSEGQIRVLLDMFNREIDLVADAVLEGISLAVLLGGFRAKNMVSPTKVITIRSDHIVEDALRQMYKGGYAISTPIEVEFTGEIVIDMGGPRRQFFTELLHQMPTKLGLVERNGLLCFLTCNSDCLLGHHYARLAHIAVHSILQEGPAFPVLPKAVYYYIVSGLDEHLSIEELPCPSQAIVKEVRNVVFFYAKYEWIFIKLSSSDYPCRE